MTPPDQAGNAIAFKATMDEMQLLKRLEMQREINVPEALHAHLPGRLQTHGLITKTPDGLYTLTEAGRELIRRREQ